MKHLRFIVTQFFMRLKACCRLVQSYIGEIIASTWCTSQLEPPTTTLPSSCQLPKPNACQHTHTQHKKTCLALKWEQWWDAMTVPRPHRGEFCSTVWPSVAQNGFWDSMPSDGQPDFLGCVGTLWPSALCFILIAGRNLHQQPTLFERQKLMCGQKKMY